MPTSNQKKEVPISDYCFAKFTVPRKYETKTGVSKKFEFLQIEGVPCIVNEYNSETNMITLNSLTSANIRNFKISREEFDSNFTEINPDIDGYLHLPAYPIPIHISEFEKRNDVTNLVKKIKSIKKIKNIDKKIKNIFKDKLPQLIDSQGSNKCIKIGKYKKYKNGKISLSKHKTFGNPIFNRNHRWAPPINITYEEFKASKSYPAPLGIRPKDFCLPSELIKTMKELINQIANFDGIDDKSFEEMKKTLTFIHKKEHLCKYCGEKINIEKYCSKYKSCDNYIEICHRDPNDRFLPRNMYWGHGDCNRRQGGFSENDIMRDGFRLAYLNGRIDKEKYEELLSLITVPH